MSAKPKRPGYVMTNVLEKTIVQLVVSYSNAVGRYGPDSQQVKLIREAHPDNQEFLDYADALDRIKRRLGGSGIDEQD